MGVLKDALFLKIGEGWDHLILLILIGLAWIGLDWIGLDWIGLDWIGLDHLILLILLIIALVTRWNVVYCGSFAGPLEVLIKVK